MPQLGPGELIIVLLIVVVIFGAGRLSEIGSALGKGIRDFRNATKDDEIAANARATTAPVATPPVTPATPVTPAAPATPIAPAATAAETKCPSCGTVNAATQTFCGQCGTRLTRAA